MTDSQSNPRDGNDPNESLSENESVSEPSSTDSSAETEQLSSDDANFVAAEGPDVETSLSDADLSFLDEASADAPGPSSEVLAAERLADLQRVTAEYANYRKRTEANREVERDRATGEVIKVLLPVLDDLDRAEKHGDLADGAFASIAQKLRAGVERLGLVPFAAVGEAFDPNQHDAIFQQPSTEVEAPTIADVIETGYYLGGTLLRAAKVVVSTPADA